MKNNKELFEELQNSIALSNLEREKYTLEKKVNWRVYNLKIKVRKMKPK